MKRKVLLAFAVALFCICATAQITIKRNKPEREQWFQQLGFGLFIHFSVDVQTGVVISHSLAGASEDYINKFFTLLPQTFNPKNFDADEIARLAKLTGIKYVVIGAKHHSGFCMYNSKTTSFTIMNTPFAKDAVKLLLDAFRKQNIATGLYFSPDDFLWLHQNKLPLDRERPESIPGNHPELIKFLKAQLKELLTNYGKIDVLFIDGQAEKHEYVNKELATWCWDIDPNIVITRGGMETPEQTLPDKALPGVWEACFTMGTSWQYRPVNERYKTATELIQLLIETRAKGGNLLLNIGPMPNGQVAPVEENNLREMALWQMVNSESIFNTEPFSVIRENNFWFTKKKNENTVFVFVTEPQWKFGERKEFFIRSLKGNAATKVSVLGHDGKIVEYELDNDPTPWCRPSDKGLLISVTRSQRLYDDYSWPNAVVIKIENVTYNEPGK